MNQKKAKALRRQARDMGLPEYRLIGKLHGKKYVMVHGEETTKGVYRKLKKGGV